MNQYVLTICERDRDRAHRLAGALTELMSPAPDALSIFEDGSEWRISAYFAAPPDLAIGDYFDAAAAAAGLESATREIAWLPLADENWVAMSQEALPPVESGAFVVHGSHDRDKIGHRRRAIEIDAGEAFGTAHHATTFGCLLAIEALAHKTRIRTVLDLGTGSGVLAIAAARIWPSARIVASDIDVDAVSVSRANIEKNGEALRVDVQSADGVPNIAKSRAGFDLVIANILAGPLSELAPAIRRATRRGGYVVLSGLLTHQAPHIQARYAAHSFCVVTHRRIEGWSILLLRRLGHSPPEKTL